MGSTNTQTATIGVIGDVHLFWDDIDTDYFNASDYDLMLFVGDLAAYSQRGGQHIARSVARLRLPTLVIPGNHDGLNTLQMGSEIFPRAQRLRHALCVGQNHRCHTLDRALGSARLVGFSRHPLRINGVSINLIAGRPHSIGGRRIACARYLERQFGVDSMERSAQVLCDLVDACDDAPIVFLAHNGPSGLGEQADSIWGCDFRKKEEDWGDRDLELAIQHARSTGKHVAAVVAGHMHRRTKSGKRRPAQVRENETLYVNAAEVPRHRSEQGRRKRHHVRLTIRTGAEHPSAETTAEDIWIDAINAQA